MCKIPRCAQDYVIYINLAIRGYSEQKVYMN